MKGLAMQATIKVYPWKVFNSFVRKAYKHKSKTDSHPVLDAVASDLHTGDLQRRDKLGHPTQPWQLPTEVAKSYLFPEEVNARPIMKAWLLTWDPAQEPPKKLTPKQEVDELGWKGALQLEEKRIRERFRVDAINISNTELAARLRKYAVKYGIHTNTGRVPEASYIRTHVISKKKVNNPNSPTKK